MDGDADCINQGSAREAEPLDILIYTNRCNKERLMWLWTWLGKSEKEMATHSSVLAWRIPGTGEPGGPPSTWSHRVGHD